MPVAQPVLADGGQVLRRGVALVAGVAIAGILLVERHHLHTGSARARALLEDWDRALPCFVKVMPRDYKRALLQARERATAKAVAAE